MHTSLAHRPPKEIVQMFITGAGGTMDMANKFYNEYECVGWMHKGQPLTNFRPRALNYIENWKSNDTASKPKRTII